jgi:flagellar basal-body rod protein FlgF
LARRLLNHRSMASGIWAAASGAVSQVALLDTAANNLANVDTNGFQPDRLVFRRVLQSAHGGGEAHPSLEYSVGRTSAHETRAGRAVPTGRDLDLALTGDGQYFPVQTADGVRYTRAGSLQIAPDGALTMQGGATYLNQNHRPIIVPLGVGHVKVENTGELSYDGRPSGERIAVVQFHNPGALVKEGNVLLAAPPAAGPPLRVDVPYLQTGALEKGSDQAMKHMSTVVQASRDFEVLSQVIQAFRDVEKSAARDISGS